LDGIANRVGLLRGIELVGDVGLQSRLMLGLLQATSKALLQAAKAWLEGSSAHSPGKRRTSARSHLLLLLLLEQMLGEEMVAQIGIVPCTHSSQLWMQSHLNSACHI